MLSVSVWNCSTWAFLWDCPQLYSVKTPRLFTQGWYTPIKAKFLWFPCVFINFPLFFWPQNITYIVLPLPKEKYTTGNTHAKPLFQMQHSLLQKLHSIIGLSPNSKFALKPKDCSCIPPQSWLEVNSLCKNRILIFIGKFPVFWQPWYYFSSPDWKRSFWNSGYKFQVRTTASVVKTIKMCKLSYITCNNFIFMRGMSIMPKWKKCTKTFRKYNLDNLSSLGHEVHTADTWEAPVDNLLYLTVWWLHWRSYGLPGKLLYVESV